MAFHAIEPRWTLWGHLPNNPDWSLPSYVRVMDICHAEGLVQLLRALPAPMLTSCMFFVMQEGVNPVWEDPKNKQGGCFSYKVGNKLVAEVWRALLYSVLGGFASADPAFQHTVTGVSISPKKGFCIIKIWMTSGAFNNPKKITIPGLNADGCMFKRHGEN